ncbi:hypothetical protein ACAW74_02290 [Fibrella sp. WM1]|uniref:hypothetical protein n=1 Tax=Fibrella musci TaxID=3242485 RepID=UPI0035221E7A
MRTATLHWGPLDLQEWTHDAAGQWIRYVSQWTWVENSAQVRRLTYDFIYGQDGRIERLNRSEGNRLVSYVEYCYAQTQLTMCNEYSATGTLLANYRYEFDDRRLREQTETHLVHSPRQVRKLFTYDAKANLTEISESVRMEGANTFIPTTRL